MRKLELKFSTLGANVQYIPNVCSAKQQVNIGQILIHQLNSKNEVHTVCFRTVVVQSTFICL